MRIIGLQNRTAVSKHAVMRWLSDKALFCVGDHLYDFPFNFLAV
ncbi:MAG: hypothetical protein ABI475_11405 [Methylophilaceae bacterium]